MNRLWGKAEKDFIKANAGKLKDREIAAKLSEMTGRVVSVEAARKQRQKLKIRKNPGRGRCEVEQEKDVNNSANSS